MSFTVYRSSAGSGKTYTLVKAYLKIALATRQSDAYRHILAITFTNKAANEMKERVIVSLRDLASENQASGTSAFLLLDIQEELNLGPDEVRWRAGKVLEHILHHYSDFSISTIDKFVYRVVRSFAHDLGLPLQFEVELDGDRLLGNAVDLLIEQVGADEQLTKALVEFTKSKADEEKSWHIESDLLQFARYLLQDDGREHLDRLRQLSMSDFFEARKNLVAELTQFESTIRKWGRQGLELIENAGIDPSLFAGGKSGIAKYFSYLAEVRDDKLLPSNSVRKNVEAGKWHATKASDIDKQAIDSIRGQLETWFWEAIQFAEQYLSGYRLAQLVVRNLYSLAVLNEMEKILEEYRNEQNLIHISEFNRRIAQVVATEPAPFIYERLGERYRHFLIDEFQDTSVLQWQNLLPLVDNSLAAGHFNMLVGDGKQSIYRWRGGEVEQFARLPALSLVEKDGLLEERENTLLRNYEEKRLVNNFRSLQEVVHFNNYFFRALTQHLDEEFASIYEGLEQAPLPTKTGGYVSVEILGTEPDSEITGEYLARTAELIWQAVDDGYSLRDITILCRRNGEASMLANYLLEEDIDVISSESLIIGHSNKVQLLVAVLEYLNDPPNRIAQAEVLLRLARNDRFEGEVFPYLRQLNQDPEAFDLPGLFQAQGYADFDPDVLLALPVYDLTEVLIKLFRLDSRKNPYLAFFLEAVFQWSGKFDAHLREFLSWWEEEADKRSIILPEGTEAVSIMTVHKSKGREFPVVIMPFTNWRVRLAKDQLWIDLPEGYGMPSALVSAGKKLEDTPYESQYREEVNKTMLDNFNVLYVAFTRAVERLYVLTSKERSKDLSNYFLPFLSQHENWNEERLQFEWGSPEAPKEKSEPSETEAVAIAEAAPEGNWRSKLQISRQAPEFWDLEQVNPSGHFGKLVHQAMARIDTREAVPDLLQRWELAGKIMTPERQELEVLLQKILSHPQIQPFYKYGLDIRKEAEILLPNGRSYRPDRVVVEHGRASILDFKTGKPAKEDRKQMEWYKKLLWEIGYLQVDSFLFYTETMTLLPI